MSETIILVFMALALILYAITGGADFGVGILEIFSPKQQRDKIRKLGEHAIAPIWEANHMWLIIALVILFIAFPLLHVRITTYLHIPLLVMLTGIILRGTAFTFRYYNLDNDPPTQRIWAILFRTGSILVPMAFGHLVASLSRGKLPLAPGDVWESYWAPWVGWFPFSIGIFTVILFAWIACVFLLGEIPESEHQAWSLRAKRWTVALVLSGGTVALSGWIENVPWLTSINRTPLALCSVLLATIIVALLWKEFSGRNTWLMRLLAGMVVTLILTGYWGAHFPNIIELSDGTSITWHDGVAPTATLDALAGALIFAGALILPGLFWLFKLFKIPGRH